jgi:hypothetical protein
MSVAAAVRSIIAADASVIALAGNRVCVDFIPEDSTMPAALLYIASEKAEDCLSGFVGFETANVRLECYGETRKQADDLHAAARASLNGKRGTYNGTRIKSISQATGRMYLVDKPNDGTDHWLFRTVQAFEVSYNSF